MHSRSKKLTCIVCALVFTIVLPPLGPAQAQEPTTMMEYYEMIPSRYFIPVIRKFIGDTKAQRDAAFNMESESWPGAEVDEKNMYIRVPTPNSVGDTEEAAVIALFLGPKKQKQLRLKVIRADSGAVLIRNYIFYVIKIKSGEM